MADDSGSLAAEEQVLFEARPRGYPSLGPAIVPYLSILALAVLMPLAGWWSMRGLATWSWKLDLGTIDFNGTGLPGGGVLSATTTLPSPLVFLVLLAALELYRVAAWKATHVVVTGRRVVVTRGVFLRRARVHARRGGERVTPERRQVVVDGLSDGPAWLDGLDANDAQGLAHALATFDPGPTPPPPRPLITWRRVGALVLALCLGLAAWTVARWAEAPFARATYEATGATSWRLDVEVDHRAFGHEATADFVVKRVLVDGVALTGPSTGAGGRSRGLLRAQRSFQQFFTGAAPARLQVEGAFKLRPERGAERFVLDLEPGVEETVDLAR